MHHAEKHLIQAKLCVIGIIGVCVLVSLYTGCGINEDKALEAIQQALKAGPFSYSDISNVNIVGNQFLKDAGVWTFQCSVMFNVTPWRNDAPYFLQRAGGAAKAYGKLKKSDGSYIVESIIVKLSEQRWKCSMTLIENRDKIGEIIQKEKDKGGYVMTVSIGTRTLDNNYVVVWSMEE